MVSLCFDHIIAYTDIGPREKDELLAYPRGLSGADRIAVLCLSQRTTCGDLGRDQPVDHWAGCRPGAHQHRNLFIDRHALVDHRAYDG